MAIIKTEAIVLHSLKYGEGRIIVDIFSREQGRLSLIVSAPRSERSKIKKQYLQPLTLLTMECDVRPQAQLQKLREASLLTPLPSLLSDPKKLSIGLFVSEFLYHALKSEQRNVPLFDYVRSSIEWLDAATGPIANFHLVFLMRLTRFLGFYPNMESKGDYFDMNEGTFGHITDDNIAATTVRQLMRMDYPTMHLFQLSRQERAEILQTLLQYYQLHLPAFPELRSLSVLKELYN
ncbi:MAG: DNA repair protein RecO [Prevotella sp.]|nr:DNA repair protein RecO [Prevotella sp.]